MAKKNAHETVRQLKEWLGREGYSEGYISKFHGITKQLLLFMDSNGISDFTAAVGLEFLRERYGFVPKDKISGSESLHLRTVQMLSEFQLHGLPLIRSKVRAYTVPEEFQEATENFLAHRRYEGIIERNMSTVSLYLERFYSYLAEQGVTKIPEISEQHIHGFLCFLTGYSNSTKDHTMRTVRQFMGFCHKNGYHPTELSEKVPGVHYDKRSRIPSAYSYDDIMKLLALVDRANPIGKRDYAVLMLLTRLGIRCGDICNLTYENIDWERNVISFTQHKTGKALTLPLLEDVGLAVIDYLKFGRPKCESTNIFVRHRAPIIPMVSKSYYYMVSRYINKAGLHVQGKKRGPHSLRHSLASRLLEENVPLPVISEILGHASTNTTAVYLSIGTDKLRMCALEV